jgi:hypothetical protein
MSTFGRKSLIWWNYENRTKENAIRFYHTPMDIQLEILEKWYPIGSKCHVIRPWKGSEKFNYVISGYTKHTSYYSIGVDPLESEVPDHPSLKKQHLNPIKVLIYPNELKRIKRESKLGRLGF